MRTFAVAERRARLARRHGLMSKLPSVEAATEAMVVLHASDPATVYLSTLARLEEPDLSAVDRALYDDRTLVRVLAMRRTLFVAPVEYLPDVEHASCPAVAAVERRKLLKYLADTGIDSPDQWLTAAANEIHEALSSLAVDGLGASARQLTTMVPRLATKLDVGAGSKHAITTGATSRVLGVLAVEGSLMRGRPTGAWTSRQHEWHLRRLWLEQVEPSANETPDPAQASSSLVQRWLRAFGPATLDDLRWWTGWTLRQLRDALSRLDVAEVLLDTTPGLALADDLDTPDDSSDPEAWVTLLPALDPTPMGWKHRHWYLGGHEGPLFDYSGNIGPTVWVNGRIVGAWGQRPTGDVTIGMLEDVGSDHRALIDANAERLSALLGGTVVKPSFPTPLQKQLST